MIQGKSLLLFISVLCCKSWLSPLPSLISVASPVLDDSYEFGASVFEEDEPSGFTRAVRGPRLRFMKRENDEPDFMTARDTRDHRLGYIKMDKGDNIVRDIRAPRLRFIKREDDDATARDTRGPRLRFVKKEPRLRFMKREDDETDSIMERYARAPRLRFIKKEDDDDMERDIRAPRLRFIKREDNDDMTRDARAPRLRFIKREVDDEMKRDTREPRLRFIKREVDDDMTRDTRAPRLRFIKREDNDDMARDTRAPRLRFIKREDDDDMTRDIRAPRLRFVKKEPRLRFIKREPRLRYVKKEPRLRFQKREAIPDYTENYNNVRQSSEAVEGEEESKTSNETNTGDAQMHSRKRRSVQTAMKLASRSKRGISTNNDLQAISDMVLRAEYHRRQKGLRNLYAALRKAGKRSLQSAMSKRSTPGPNESMDDFGLQTPSSLYEKLQDLEMLHQDNTLKNERDLLALMERLR